MKLFALNGAVASSLEPITTAINGMFNDAKTAGLALVIGAIGIGVIFVAGKWIWGVAKEWLKKAK